MITRTIGSVMTRSGAAMPDNDAGLALRLKAAALMPELGTNEMAPVAAAAAAP
jgi:hypothetical protein